ncbi:site-specific integrase [Phyllobacterium sp. OV277]|uniref:site-specific integrase n=1 Tax=Phyllobacterium sp. OV277 TaxID=1882772 RepID=UPI00088AD68B|nr:site-specific integrase [Phyllobacterium sp. OV277]SDP09515.1 Site-specific recombinase XerD [Phyllobacterium sp. OV277]
MSRKSKGAHIYWRDESRKADGSLRNRAGWFIRDGSTFVSVGGGETDRGNAEKALAKYLADKYEPSRERGRDSTNIQIADVVSIYVSEVAPKHTKPHETAARLGKILDFFGNKTLDQINGQLCRAYADFRRDKWNAEQRQFVKDWNASIDADEKMSVKSKRQRKPDWVDKDMTAGTRRQLEDLRSAINYYKDEGYSTIAPTVWLPEKPAARDRWLTRQEAASLLWAAWRMTQSWKGQESKRRTGRHLARFILVALYTGTRSAAICAAAIRPTVGTGYVDLDRGVFYRRAPGTKQTKKRQPPIPIPRRLLVHLRRWSDTPADLGKPDGPKISQSHVVEWNGKPVTSVKKSFRAACKAAQLGSDVMPHILRHTAATWLMQSGADVWQSAGFLGMTVETLINTYGHHHPDHLQDAANAVSSPHKPHGMTRIKREHQQSNVIKIPANTRVS